MNKMWLKLATSLLCASAAQAQMQAPEVLPPSEFPEAKLLYKQQEVEGYSAESAFRFCDLYKKLYQQDYFVVYCVFRDKSWDEIRYALEPRTDYVFVGYATDATSQGYGLRGVYMNRHTGPVLVPIETRVWVPYVERRQIFGLEVWGFGRISELPWQTVFTSMNPADGMLPPVTYTDPEDAKLRCALTLAELQRDPSQFPKYQYSRCAVTPAGPLAFAYEIQVKNPFLIER